jgi:hypothetical protein
MILVKEIFISFFFFPSFFAYNLNYCTLQLLFVAIVTQECAVIFDDRRAGGCRTHGRRRQQGGSKLKLISLMLRLPDDTKVEGGGGGGAGRERKREL